MIPLKISPRSWAVLGIGFAAVIVQAALIVMQVGGESGALWASDLGEALVVGASGAFVLWAALSFNPGEPIRRQWIPIGLGVLAFAAGDLVWTYLEAYRGIEVPYPGLPDLFYLLEYPLIAYGLIVAGRAYQGLVPLRKPLMITVTVCAVLSIAVIAGLIVPTILPADVTLAEKLLSSAYPLFDIVFSFGPAFFVAFVVRGLGGGRLAWPWQSVVFGVALLGLSDFAYSWLSAFDLYASGSVIDYGWSLGHVFIAFGAALALDLARPHEPRG